MSVINTTAAEPEVMDVAEEAIDDLRGRFLTFNIGDTFYGIELLHISDIISVQPITRVPGLPAYFKGIINLRGKVVPIIDVRLKLGQEEREYDDKTCFIVVNVSEMQVGLIVDRVDEVVNVNAADRNPPPDLGAHSNERYLSSIVRIDDKVILNIDCDKFFQSDRRTY